MLIGDIIFIVSCPLLMGGYLLLKKTGRMTRFLGFTAFLPFVAMIVSMILTGFEKCLIPAYIGAVLFAVCFGLNGIKGVLSVTVTAAVVSLGSLIPCCAVSSYRDPNYIGEFNKMFSLMKRHYVLTDYKQTDWDGIYKEYYPRVAALKRNSDDEFYKICYLMSNEFNDPHISILPAEVSSLEATVKLLQRDLCGKDCGFAAVRLDDGRILACCVSENSDAYAAGLRTGCELTSFNGMEINEYIASTDPDVMSFGDIDNLEFFRSICAFGIEEDSAKVGFVNEEGESIEAEIRTSGYYYDRIRTTKDLLFGKDDEYYNYDWRDIGGDTACLVLSDFMADPALRDEEEMTELRRMWEENEKAEGDEVPYPDPMTSIYLKRALDEIKAAGMKKLVIDLRNNGGGDLGRMGYIASYFTDEPLYLASEVYTDRITGKETSTEPQYVKNYTNEWGDGDIVILIGSNTASAAEIFARSMSKLPNVTVMGLTESAGCAMAVSGTKTERLMFNFPMYKMVDEDGNILIDSGADMQSTAQIDVKLSFDEQAFKAIFEDKTDYTLEKAKEYLAE